MKNNKGRFVLARCKTLEIENADLRARLAELSEKYWRDQWLISQLSAENDAIFRAVVSDGKE